MCTTNILTYQYPDGQKKTVKQPNLCPAARHNRPCPDNVLFQHPLQFVGSSSAPASSPYLGGGFQPTPPYTPQGSSTPTYRSGDESDRSHRSGSSSGRGKKRSSSIYVSVNGQPVVDLNRRSDRLGTSSHRDRERIVLVDSPPTPRTPPQTYTGPHTAPPSPSMPYIVDAPAPRESSSRRPVIVDERPRVKIEVIDPRSSSKHARHSSTSSYESRHSRHSHTDDEERERRRQKRHEERRLAEEELREQKMRARIAKANAEISRRHPVPMAPTPPPPKRSSTFTRPVVEVPVHRDLELEGAMRRLRLEKEAKRRVEKAEREEEEAQRQRLIERMQPKRRATVGPGSRRHRVLYDDGVYRWE